MNREANLGDPISFSTYLIWQLTRSEQLDGDTTRLTDWNLDADRGYAWKCWDWNRSSNLTFEDSEGNIVQRPCTPPSQFDDKKHGGSGHDPNIPLQIHWADTDDPHCEEGNQ